MVKNTYRFYVMPRKPAEPKSKPIKLPTPPPTPPTPAPTPPPSPPALVREPKKRNPPNYKLKMGILKTL